MDRGAVDFGQAAGVVVDTGRGRVFVEATQALRVLEAPRLSPVPNAGFSLLWFEGEVIAAVPFQSCVAGPAEEPKPVAGDPVEGAAVEGAAVEGAVVAASPGGRSSSGAVEDVQAGLSEVLVCELGGQRYALTGVRVLASGVLDLEGRTVRFAGAAVPHCRLVPPGFLNSPSEPTSERHIRGRMFVGGDGGPRGPEDAGTP